MGTLLPLLVPEQLLKVELVFAIFELKSQELQAQLDLFKAAQVFHPVCVRCGATPSAVDVRSRAAQIPCLNSEITITALVDEQYYSVCPALKFIAYVHH